jgi:1-carboxybiuret hydrolase
VKDALSLARDVREGRCTATSVLDETIARIDARNDLTNSFVTRTYDRARREACEIDRRRRAGESLPVLAGVPYAVKNLFDVEGIVTLSGGKVNAGGPPAPRDAVLVSRMRAAGAVLVGTLNMDEHAYGFTTENTHYGATRNPHDPTRIAGGSSGGSAAAIAGGLVPLTLGSDTNGSIRVPSALCGTFGLKPTFGRLPRTGSFPFVASLDHLGPFAATMADLAATYDVLQGADPEDAACAQRPVDAVFARIAGGDAMPSAPRIAILGGYFREWADASARSAVDLAAAAMGATNVVELSSAAQARAAAFVITAAQGGALHLPRLRTRYDEYEPHSRDRLVAGSLVPASWVERAQRVRRHVYEEALRLFEHYDLLIAPATPVVATPIGAEWININGSVLPCRPSMGLLTQPISCIGLPVSVAPLWPNGLPAGKGSANGVEPAGSVSLPRLPIGVQLIAAPWREDTCLAAAAFLEHAGVAVCGVA